MVASVAARLVGFLPAGLRPFAKAIVPPVLVLASVGVQAFIDGHYDPSALDAALHGLEIAVLTFLVPNVVAKV